MSLKKIKEWEQKTYRCPTPQEKAIAMANWLWLIKEAKKINVDSVDSEFIEKSRRELRRELSKKTTFLKAKNAVKNLLYLIEKYQVQ